VYVCTLLLNESIYVEFMTFSSMETLSYFLLEVGGGVMSLLAGAQVMLLSYFLLEVGGGVMSLLAGAQVAQVTQVQPSRSTPVSLCEWPWCHGPARAASRFSLHCRLIW
jgi:hypothetical protein